MTRIVTSITAAIKSLLLRNGIKVERFNSASSHELRLVQMLAANHVDLVIDVGANTGGYAKSIRASGYRGRILSFEPLESAHAALVNACHADESWAAAPRMALGEVNGRVTINVAGNSTSSSMLDMLESHRRASPQSSYVAHEVVDVRRLDSVSHPFVAEAERPFLKIDTQGYESHVLAGAEKCLGGIRGLQLELSLQPLYEGQRLWRDMIATAEAAGFDLWALVPGFFDPVNGRLLQCDAIFFRL